MPTAPPPAEQQSLPASVLSALRRNSKFGSRTQAPDTQPPSTRPNPRTGIPDPIRAEFWAAYCYLFPPHALVNQNESGSLVISWSMTGDPHATSKYAAPVMLRFEPDLIAMMKHAPPDQRKRIISQQEAVLRGGLIGYDPYNSAQARIIVLG
ncbi:hypothetical protein [Ramlibacter albus]|uniref:Uncharacterized protein n=1 Tax=Ramlibacter albus TaxID=2079448 RepID=A0A923M5J6_9BURK|nr:hypothetical protein [Ramlibacter albus]MBC5764340.1 hypothetical protein [Ramlibacter albus]